MAYNYGNIGNPALQSSVPLFHNPINGVNAVKQTTFIPHLSTNVHTTLDAKKYGYPSNVSIPTCSSSPVASIPPSYFNRNKRSPTPEAPPAPRLSDYLEKSNKASKNKSDKGAQPMDLEIDDEIDEAASNSITKTAIAEIQKTAASGSNLMLNTLIGTGVNSSVPSYMFFPTAPGPMLMDHATIMAATMQQMQGYGGYMPTTVENTGSIIAENSSALTDTASASIISSAPRTKEIIKTKNCTLFPPNPNALPPTIRERPLGCRTVFVGGLPEAATEEIIREIFEPCGEITTLRMSKKNFCHIRFRLESSIDRAIFLSGFRMRISSANEPTNFGRLHVDYAQARDDQYEYECKQRQLQREQRHRDRSSLDRKRSQSPPPIPHYSDHEASLVSESLRTNDSFIKAIQTITVWLERGDCNKRNTNIFYSMIQSTHAHVRRLHSEKQQLEDDLKKAREKYRKQMLVMSKQFTQIEKVFNAASHKKVWDHFSKAQRKNIDQWKKLATELRSIQIEDDEMEMSDDDRAEYNSNTKRSRYDTEQLRDENDSLRCQLEALRNEISLERTDIKYNTDAREKQMKVLQETIRNMQTELIRIKAKEQKDVKIIEQLEHKVKESAVKQLLLKTKIRETNEKLRDRGNSSKNSETSDILLDITDELKEQETDVRGKETSHNEDKDKNSKSSASSEQDENIVLINDNIKSLNDNIVTNQSKTKIEAESSRSIEEEQCIAPVEAGKTETEVKLLTKQTKENFENELLPKEARIIALVTAFLIVHPWGTTSDCIGDYLREFTKSNEYSAIALTDLLNKYKNIFQATPISEKSSDSNVAIKWNFCGYDEKNFIEK